MSPSYVLELLKQGIGDVGNPGPSFVRLREGGCYSVIFNLYLTGPALIADVQQILAPFLAMFYP